MTFPPAPEPTAPTPLSPGVHGINAKLVTYYYDDQHWTNRMTQARRFGEYNTGTGLRTNTVLVGPNSPPRADGYPASLASGFEARTACAGPRSTFVGTWVCAWDGDGTVRFDTADGNTVLAAVNGRIERTIVAAGDRMGVHILTTNAGNPVRNMRVFYKPYEQYLLGDGLDPDYVARTLRSRINGMRFMNLTDTQRSAHVTNALIPPDEYYTDSSITDVDDEAQSLGVGCRIKLLTTLIQRFGLLYPMLQVPHRAWEDPTNSWINTMIPRLFAVMPPNGKLLIGVSNEVWEGHSFGTPYFLDAGINGLPAAGLAPFSVTGGDSYANMSKAYAIACKRAFVAARAAAIAAGVDPARVVRVIECQATAGISYFYQFRTRDWIDDMNVVDIPFDIYSPSFYHSNNLNGDQGFTFSSGSGTFVTGEVVHNGLVAPDRREGTVTGLTLQGRLIVAIDRNPYSPFSAGQSLIGATSGANKVIADDGLANTFLPAWTPQDFFDYAFNDIARRAIDGDNGFIAACNMVAGRNATCMGYEGTEHEYSSTYGAPALAALYAYYRNDKSRELGEYLYSRMRGTPNSNGHGMIFDTAGFPFGRFESYLDDGGNRPGSEGMNNEPRFLAMANAGQALLGGGGGGNLPPEFIDPGPQTIALGGQFQLQLAWTDPNQGDTHTVICAGLPPGWSCSLAGFISGEATQVVRNGSPYLLVATVTDQGGELDQVAIPLTITGGGGGGGTNFPPVLTNPGPRTATEGELFLMQVQWTDPNMGDTHVVSWLGLPTWLIGHATGAATGTPPAGASAGSPHTVTVTVTDQGLLADSKQFVLTVVPGGGGGGPGVQINVRVGTDLARVVPLTKDFYLRQRR